MLTSGAAVGRATIPRSRWINWLRSYGFIFLALFLLGTSKWGSYLPFIIPPYLSDMVLGVVLAHRILYGARGSLRSYRDGSGLRPAVGLLVLWAVIEFVRGPVNFTAIRDFAPYFYATAVLLVELPPDSRQERISKLIRIAMYFHGLWCSLAVVAPKVYGHLPFFAGQIHFLQPRNDFDGAVCGIFAAMCAHQALSGRAPFLNAGLSLWNIVLDLYLKERAGLVALVLCMVVVVWLSARRRSTTTGGAKAIVPLLLILLPIAAYAGNKTPGYQRLVAAIHPYVPFVHSTKTYSGATATEKNRQKAWARIAHWLDDSPERAAVGVGFGPNFMHESGADVILFGGTLQDARSPHNYYVGTWARLGYLGVGLAAVITLLGLYLCVLVKRRAPELTDLDVLAMLLVVGIASAAAVGVILESPFGAMPWFWALGHLSRRSAQVKDAADPAPPSHAVPSTTASALRLAAPGRGGR